MEIVRSEIQREWGDSGSPQYREELHRQHQLTFKILEVLRNYAD